MKNVKKLMAIGLALIMVLSLVACSSDAEPAPKDDKSNEDAVITNAGETAAEDKYEYTEDGRIIIRIANCLDNVDISMQGNIDAIDAYVTWLNAHRDDIYVEVTHYDGQATVDKQIGDIETAVAMGNNVIILNPVDKDGVYGAAQEAMQDGVAVIGSRDITDTTVTSQSGNENIRGQYVADYLCKWLEEHPEETLKVGLIFGSTNHPAQFPRMEGAKAAAEKYPDRIEFVVEQYGDWGSDSAMRIMEDWLQVYDLNCIVTGNEEMMIGVVEVLRGEGTLDDYVLCTHNGEKPGLDMVAEGVLDTTIGQVMTWSGPLSTETAIRAYLEGLTGAVDYTDVLLFPVTIDNLEDYSAKYYFTYEGLETCADLPWGCTLKDSYK